jgi:hypothetical protein
MFVEGIGGDYRAAIRIVARKLEYNLVQPT